MRFVTRRIGRILKLLRDERAGDGRMQFNGFVDRTLHAFRAVGQYDLRSVGGGEFSPLDAHGLGHGEDKAVTPDRRDERERERMARESQRESAAKRYEVDRSEEPRRAKQPNEAEQPAKEPENSIDNDDFDYDKYMAHPYNRRIYSRIRKGRCSYR